MSKSIRVEEDVHETLASLKGDDETFNDVLARLLRDRRETIESGAGLWAGTDAAAAAREAREDLKEDVGAR